MIISFLESTSIFIFYSHPINARGSDTAIHSKVYYHLLLIVDPLNSELHTYISFLLRQVGLRQPKDWCGPARI